MGKCIDLAGRVFSRLTVLGVHGRDKHGRFVWECACVCGSKTNVASRALLSGKTKSCGCISLKGNLLYGVGLYEWGEYKSCLNGKTTKEYKLWLSMLKRCYCEKHQERYPTYRGCEASDNFKDFQYFAKWCGSQIGFNLDNYQLDKDLLGNGKLYSENTCCFIPIKLNSHFTCREALGFHKVKSGKFTSSCSSKHLGTFLTQEEAISAYKIARASDIRKIIEDNHENLDPRVLSLLEGICS